MIDRLREAYAQSKMIGWDFSRLEGKMTSDEPSWDFEGDCHTAMAEARRTVDLVTYLALVPWDAPNFTVDRHADRLIQLDHQGPLHVTQRRFRVYATKLGQENM